MSDNKLILFLKLGALGSIIAWAIFLGSNVGFPKSPHPIIFSIALTASAFVSSMILISPFLYTKKERKVDKLLGEKSSVDEASNDLLYAIEYEIEPAGEYKPKYTAELAAQILLAEIKIAKEAGASNELIGGYLQRELESWIGGTLRDRSEFEVYTQLIEDLKQ